MFSRRAWVGRGRVQPDLGMAACRGKACWHVQQEGMALKRCDCCRPHSMHGSPMYMQLSCVKLSLFRGAQTTSRMRGACLRQDVAAATAHTHACFKEHTGTQAKEAAAVRVHEWEGKGQSAKGCILTLTCMLPVTHSLTHPPSILL